MNPTCGCCEGVGNMAQAVPDNRPGLGAIVYRVGTHFTLLETMKARLSSGPLNLQLLGLRSRDGSDFSIALLDAWAMVADVLTFYQERIANEGYLRTATERLSILELSRLMGYELRPGVASSVFLAYTIDTDVSKKKPPPTSVSIPAGSRAQSMPGPGELPQSFETSAALYASDQWNNLGVRQTMPGVFAPPGILESKDTVIYFKGISTNLKPGDRLLLDFGGDSQVSRTVLTVDPDNANNRTKVTLVPLDGVKPDPVRSITKPKSLLEATLDLTTPLTMPPASNPASSAQLRRDVSTAFSSNSELIPRVASAFHPQLAPQQLFTAFENADQPVAQQADVHVFRTRASPFGATAHKKNVFGPNNQIKESVEWPLTTDVPSGLEKFSLAVFAVNVPTALPPDASNPVGVPAGWVVFTSVRLGEAPHLITHSDVQSGLKSGAAFAIDFTAAGDRIDVTLTASPDSDPPVKLVYRFAKRSLGFSIGPSTKALPGHAFGIEILADGTNPTTATIFDDLNIDLGPHTHALSASVLFSRIFSPVGGSNQLACLIEGTAATASITLPTEGATALSLDNLYDKIVPGGWILLEGAMTTSPLISRIQGVRERSRADYGITGKITDITLDSTKPWLDLSKKPDLGDVRKVAVFAQSEKLELAESPVVDPLSGSRIELDGIYPGLESGRWLIVSGKRIDVNVPAAELVLLAGSEMDRHPDLPDDALHTFLTLASKGLAYSYDPATVTIYGNVVHATHGETRAEVLGSGDAAQTLQEFQLKQAPLTYVSAATTSGTEDSLKIRVNDILWHNAPDLASLGPNDRSYLIRATDDSKTTVVFGNGIRGVRIPTGVENIKAVYRTGIGKPGNVGAEQISLLSTKPLGVKAVINPLRASGGADRESRDSARRNIPLAVMSLDRLVSIQDYADFARTFAGVGKASATQVGNRVQVIIAGADYGPLDESSDLYVNLLAAFGKFGDPQQPIQLTIYEPMFVVIQAKVAVLPDYQFETVAPQIRETLLAALAFVNRDLGQDVLQSEIIAAIQGVEGVQYVDLDTLDVITSDLSALQPSPATAVQQTKLRKRISVKVPPAQLPFLNPDISETLILTELVDAR